MKKLLIYYSYSGNTKSIANKIKEKINCDEIELETKIPYDSNYDKVVEQAKTEIKNNYQPELKEIKIDIEKYDTLIIGMPVWWYTFAPPIKTFLNSYDLSNKKIIPFITNGGWIGHTIKDIKKACPNSEVINDINLLFEEKNLQNTNEFNNWLEKLTMERK